MTSAVSRPPLHPLCSLSSAGRPSSGPAPLLSPEVAGGCCARTAEPPPPPDVVGGDQSDVAALGQQRTASALVMDVCFVETELKRLSRWSLAASELNASKNNNIINNNNNNNMQAIRCTASNCSCDCFSPGKGTHQARACDNCRHGWVAHALDKLHHLQHPPPASSRSPPVPPFCGQPPQHPPAATPQPSSAVPQQHHPLQNPVELVSANLAFDVASLMLFGAQAIPIRLKILLDRLFSVLAHDDVLRVLHGFGWTYDDYTRGYILQDPAGSVLDRWTLASRDEEPLILQQFLRFGETKAIAQHLLLQETGSKPDPPKLPSSSNGPLSELDLKRLVERRGVPLFKAHLPPTCTSSSSSPIATCNTSSVTTTASSTGAAPKPFHRQPGSSISSLSPAGSPVRCGSPVSVSPLNKLQNMQPCDFRRDKSSPDAAARASENAATAHHNGSPISSPTTGVHLQQPHHLRTLASMHHHSLQSNNHSDLSGLSEDDMGYSDSDSLQEGGAMNLSQGVSHLDSIYAARKVRHLRKSANPMRRRWNPMVLSTLTTNPSTGKKRVQCHVCLKTFCDKGALKIHFSAVHLREMHKCTVEGCNMMFSSRRSRNRHSANPNPKLHTPNFRRKINPHDGRSSNPYPLIPASGMVGYGGGLSNNSVSLPPSTLDLERPFAITGDAPAPPLRLPVTVKCREESPPPRPSLAALPEPPQQSSPAPDDSGALALTIPKKPRLTSEDAEPCSDSSRPEEGMNLSLKDAALQQNQQLEQQVNNKGTRKRKSQHPTKCAAVESEDDDVDDYATTDDDSSSDTYIDQLDDDNGLLGSKSEDEEDEDMGETSDDLLDDSKDGRFFAAGSALLEKRLQERGRYSGAFPILQPAKRETGEEDEKENSVPGEGDKERPSMTAFNGTTQQEIAENPLRHLESLSLGAFTNMVLPRNHHHQHHSHHHSPSTGPPLPPRNSSGVSFHAPGLGLGSSSINSPTVEREPSVTPGYMSDPENSSTYGDGGQGLSMLPAFRDASMVGAVDIPVDKDNPRRCTACGKIFQNHFGVKTHYQNVHLKLMHKCTVEGCNAAFPSKRSRDRHSANLNLHRKLLSTTGDKQSSYMHQDKPHLHGYPFHPAAAAAAAAAGAVVRDDFFSRLYDPQSLPLNFAELYQGRMPGDGLVGFPSHLGSSPLGGLPFHPAFLPPTGHLPLTRSSGLDGRDSPASSLTSPSPHSYTRSPLPLSTKEPVSLVRSRSSSPVRRKDEEPTNVTLDEDLSPDADGKYSCSLCLKKFHESVVLREHYEKAHTRELERCSVESCGKVFTSRTIRDHERSHRTSPADTRELEGAAS